MNFKYFLIFLLSLHSLSSIAELSVRDQKISNERVEIYADNPDNFPYTITLQYELKNCNLKYKQDTKFLVPANVKRFPINEITILKGYASYSFKYNYWKGNQLNAVHNNDYVYAFPCDEKFNVIQGYHGSYSHTTSKALDFKMPVGSNIYAARDGIVLQLKEDSNTNCRTPACYHQANFIFILHEDGSIANYAHLKQNGVLVNIGDPIKKGQIIGLSGNTGWSGTPHLHFEVYTEKDGVKISHETQFINGIGKIINGRNMQNGK